MPTPAEKASVAARTLSAEKQEQDLHATVEHLRAQIAEREGTIRRYRESHGGRIELAREICQAVKALTPHSNVPYKPRDKNKAEVAFVANLSDLHIGEITRPAETGGFGAFNYDIARKRMKSYVTNLIDWVTCQRSAYNIPDLTVFGIGDYVSGNIHQELLVTNEFTLPGQTARAAQVIAESLRLLTPHFRNVTFHGIGADNHGRLQPKPQAKQKSENNMSYLVHALIEAYMAGHGNFKLIAHEDMKPTIEVAAHRFLVHHGDTIKCVLGVPFYGLERDRGREATRRMKAPGRDFDYVNIGHFHVPNWLSENIFINGSLSGTSEFDHSCGRHAAPAQISYLVHPRWGAFNYVPWKSIVEQDETDRRRIK